MSLILEALKKSEQQRRLGEAPTLGTPIVLARRRRNLLPLLALAIAAALGVGWWLSRTPAPVPTPVARPGAAAPTGAATPAAPTPPTAAPPPRPAASAAPAPHGKIGGAVAVTPPPAAAPAPTAAPVLPVTRPDDRPGSVTLPAALPAQAPVVEGPGAVHDRPEPAGPASPLPAASAPAASAPAPAPAPKPAPVPTPTPTPAPASPPPAPTAAAAAPAYPSVWELPYAVRKDLPALNVTMHVYAPAPADRFVVINGERHGEGDQVADGVTLKQISSDGMVLDFRGHSFTFPRDGR